MENQNDKIASLILRKSNTKELNKSIKLMFNNWMMLFLQNGDDNISMFDELYNKKYCDILVLWEHIVVNQKVNIMNSIYYKNRTLVEHCDKFSKVIGNLYIQNKIPYEFINKLLLDSRLYVLLLNDVIYDRIYMDKKYDFMFLMVKKGFLLGHKNIKRIIQNKIEVMFHHVTNYNVHKYDYPRGTKSAFYYAYKFNNTDLLLELYDKSCTDKVMEKICQDKNYSVVDLFLNNKKCIKKISGKVLDIVAHNGFDHIFKMCDNNAIKTYCYDINTETIDCSKLVYFLNVISTPSILTKFLRLWYNMAGMLKPVVVEYIELKKFNKKMMYFGLNSGMQIKETLYSTESEPLLYYLKEHNVDDNLVCKKIIDKYNNCNLWTPKKHKLFPPRINKFILNILMIMKEYSKTIKQIIPKPITYIITNYYIF